jgi:hypothetical protein
MKAQNLAVSFLFLAMLLSSCNHNNHKINAEFKIINNTTTIIDSLCIEPNDLHEFISINPNTSISYLTDMTNTARIDGRYSLKYILADKHKSHHFGYYSNGLPMEKLTIIKINADTVIFHFEY